MSQEPDLVQRALARAKTSGDLVLAGVMAMVIGAMIVPLPSWLLDVGLAINLAAALSLLVGALYARSALEVATFPTLLLLTTLFRLALNVSSTRLALSEGHAGELIQAFGEFVVRGNYVVGAVIFAILTLVQFVVVTKGAERVAEVSARFTLDAMPGKQLSIDADLRSGAISQGQARTRRRQLERESQLFGSMDGAMKFVKGDAIAGLVIALINLLGGIVIGVLEQGMPAAEAAGTYALISIGDGLASQLPSLSIAVAAGIVVTRVASENEEASLGTDIGSQFFGQPRALFVVAILCLALAVMPGMPHLTFLILALLLALAGRGLQRVEATSRGDAKEGRSDAATTTVGEVDPRRTEELVQAVAPLLLDVGDQLGALVEAEGQRFVKVDLEQVRERLFLELGVRLPAFRVRLGAPLPGRSYALSVDELPAGGGTLPEGTHFAMLAPSELATYGLEARTAIDPAGRTVSAVSANEAQRLSAAGVVVRRDRELFADHLLALVKKRAPHFLGVQEVHVALTSLEHQAPALVKEALHKVPLPLLTEVLKKLLQEQVSIRNFRAILDALVSPMTEGDAAQLAERCRAALARQLSQQYANGGPLFAFLVDPSVEESLRLHGQGLDPSQAGAILEGVKRIARQGRAVLLSSPDTRRALKRLLEGSFPDVAVLTFTELDPELQVRPVGRLLAAPAR